MGHDAKILALNGHSLPPGRLFPAVSVGGRADGRRLNADKTFGARLGLVVAQLPCGHLDPVDAQSALTVKSIPRIPARIRQIFARMPRVPMCLAGILWPNAAKRHVQETSSGFSRSGKFTRTGTASQHFDLAFCAGGVAVLLDSRSHGRARPTSRWPPGHLDSVDVARCKVEFANRGKLNWQVAKSFWQVKPLRGVI